MFLPRIMDTDRQHLLGLQLQGLQLAAGADDDMLLPLFRLPELAAVAQGVAVSNRGAA
jgi:hypothetical protein